MTAAPLAGTEFSFVNMAHRLRVAGGKLLFIDAGGNSFEVNEIGFHKGDDMTVLAAGLPPRRYSLTRQQDLFDWLWDNNKTHMIAPMNKVFTRSGTPVAPPCAAPAPIPANAARDSGQFFFHNGTMIQKAVGALGHFFPKGALPGDKGEEILDLAYVAGVVAQITLATLTGGRIVVVPFNDKIEMENFKKWWAAPIGVAKKAARAAGVVIPVETVYGSPPPGSKFYYPTARAPAKSCPECAGTGVYVSQISGRKSPCSMCKP